MKDSISIRSILEAVYGCGRNSRLKLSDHEVVEVWLSVDQAEEKLLQLLESKAVRMKVGGVPEGVEGAYIKAIPLSALNELRSK